MRNDNIPTKYLLAEFNAYDDPYEKVQFLLYCRKRFGARKINWDNLIELWSHKIPQENTTT